MKAIFTVCDFFGILWKLPSCFGSEIQNESKKVGTVVISALINEKSTSLAVINTSDSGNQLNIRNKGIVLI